MFPTKALTLLSTLTASVSSHGVVTMIKGANGVDMPGLSGITYPPSPLSICHPLINTHTLKVADGTPRDCSTNRCGSQADTAIIRDREIRRGEVGPLGRTQGNGPIDAATMISNFMGLGGTTITPPTNQGSNSSVGVEDDLSALNRPGGDKKRAITLSKRPRQFLDGLRGLFGGGAGGGGRGEESDVASETNVQATAGAGASSGLPTCGDDGSVEMVFHQVGQLFSLFLLTLIDPDPDRFDSRSTKTVPVRLKLPSTAPREEQTSRLSKPQK